MMAKNDDNTIGWVEVLTGASSFFSNAMRGIAYGQEGKKLHAAGLAVAAGGSAFIFVDGLIRLVKTLKKPTTLPGSLGANGLYGEWLTDDVNGTISIVGRDADFHIFVPNSAGRFNILSGGADSNSRRPFFAATGANSRNQQMLSMGQLSDGRDSIQSLTTTILEWRDGDPVFSDAIANIFMRPRKR